MDRLLEQLIENLCEEKEVYRRLLDLSEQKKQIILEKKIKELEQVVQAEQEFIVSIGSLEEERQDIIERIAEEKGVNPGELSISKLISWASGEMRLQLENIKKEFEDIIEKQKALNYINERLLKTNLEYVDFAIHFLTGSDGSGSIYEKQGQASPGKQSRNLFDRKV